MLKKISLLSTVILITGCNSMPGMQNLNTSQMAVVYTPQTIEVHPVLIPITPSLIANQKISTYFYHVSPSDVLQINVWEHPEFNVFQQPNNTANTPGIQGAAGQLGYLVNPEGKIAFPLLGYVHVGNKTVDEIRTIITKGLKKYIPNPQVNVRVADYRGQKIYVVGDVKNPGFLPLTDQVLTIADALALSGGIDQDLADPGHIYVIRGSIDCPEIFWLNARTADQLMLAEYFSLYPKDILYISSAPATQWNRVLKQLLPTIQTIWYTKAITTNN